MTDHNDSQDIILRTEDLSRQVGSKYIVKDISIEVHHGQIIAVIGPSGAGKSSFLRLLNRLDEPTSGTVYYQGTDYRTIPPRDLRQKIGMVLQAPYLFPGTVAENIRFGPEQNGETIKQEEIEYLLSEVRLEGYAGRNIANLSGGEAQRVSLARTLANRPNVLLLDEPTSALDEAARRDVENLILKIIEDENLTCLMVTHDMEQARRMANVAMGLKAGQLVEIGPIQEVLSAEYFD